MVLQRGGFVMGPGAFSYFLAGGLQKLDELVTNFPLERWMVSQPQSFFLQALFFPFLGF